MNINFKNLPSLFIQAALITAAATLAVVVVTRFVSPIPLSINQTTTQKDTAFNVTGESSVATAPDKVEVTLGISIRDTSLQAAQSRGNEVINAINQKLQEMGVKKEDIKTQNYTIYPNYDYQKSGQDIIGYSVDISILVSTTDFEKLNQIVDTATSLGANQVSGVQFTLSESKEKEVKEQARAQAIEDAKANAQELARLAGMRLGRIINIIETPNVMPGPFAMERAASGAGGGGGAPTDIQPGSTNYTYSVTLSYETL